MADLQTQMKQAVADAAVQQIRDGMVLGLGSGSTAALMIKALGAKLASGELKDIVGVTTSFQGEVLAAELGISLLSLNAVSVGTARKTPEPCYRSDTKKPPSYESGFICAVKGGQGEDNLHSVSHGIPRGAGYLSNACPQIRFLKKFDYSTSSWTWP